MLTATEIATFRRTAYHGTLMVYRLTRFEIDRTQRYMTSQEAIAVYQLTWTALKIAMALAVVAGIHTRNLWEHVRGWVDATVAQSLPSQGTVDHSAPSDAEHTAKVVPNPCDFDTCNAHTTQPETLEASPVKPVVLSSVVGVVTPRRQKDRKPRSSLKPAKV